MNTSTNVVRLRQPEEFEDPLTDIRARALDGFSRRLWSWRPRRSWPECRISSCLTGVIVWFGTGTVPSG